jgi:hypothetical protein
LEISRDLRYGPTFYQDYYERGNQVTIVDLVAMHCTFTLYTSIILIMMDTKMMALFATMVLPMFAAAREGPDCPADPYVRVYHFESDYR